MCTRILFAALLISLLATLVAITIGNPKSVSAGEPSWVEIRSPNFSVVTDAGEKRGREVAMRFEQMRAVFGALMTKAKVNLPVPLQIVAFRGTKEMRQVAPLWNGKPTQVAGLFQGGEDRCFIMLDLSVPDPYPVVFHEYAHQLMNGNMHGEMDPWFEEGFAEYFASIEVDNKQARVGKVPADEYLVLQHPALAAQVSILLTQARKFREAMQQHPQGIEQGALPPRREESDAKSDPLRESPPSSTSSRTVGKWGAPKFVHGIINGVDCSSALAAVLALQMGTKTVKLTVNDRDHVILIGADQFSCAWNKRKVAVNYRENDAGDTSVMSIELQ